MDTSTILATAGVSTTTIAILALLYSVWKYIEGHRFVSQCCKKKYKIGIAVEDFTPPLEHQSKTQNHLHIHTQDAFSQNHHATLKAPLLTYQTEPIGDTNTLRSVLIEEGRSFQGRSDSTTALPTPPPSPTRI